MEAAARSVPVGAARYVKADVLGQGTFATVHTATDLVVRPAAAVAARVSCLPASRACSRAR